MKTTSLPSPISLNVILLALLIVAIVFIAVTGKKVPILSNTRVVMGLVLVLGMAMCTSGIGRVAALQQWTHPLSILGYLIGIAILAIGLGTVIGWKLPFIQSDVQAILVITVLIGLKVVNTLAHSLFTAGA
ncbi:MAG: hypothetical protein PVJ21_08160 [Anaerolineales bacterium]|jgi:hypothetical protein